ncbi:YopX family protein [Paenibacillus sp. RC84]|uniref:YopX family protein n=1 Tax=Paenibacillus sp. RC84 TaxID=3156252 RepID=UPI0035197C9D
MSRPIKFRGKSMESGEWVYGSLISDRYIVGDVIDWNEDYFNTEWWAAVDPETVGQYTGLNDRKGTGNFDGDIILEEDIENSYIFRTIWSDTDASFYFEDTVTNERFQACDIRWNYVEIIGNIYEHPHLLEQKEEGK